MNMKLNIYFIIFFLPLLFSCKNSKNPTITNFNTPVLSYKHMHGWTGRITLIKVFENKNGTKIRDEKETTIKFTPDEKIKLDSLIVQFPEFERTYKPEIGTCCDIDFHYLVHYTGFEPDSISIFEPLEIVPMRLRKFVELFMAKL
jgi:hypothetical protein